MEEKIVILDTQREAFIRFQKEHKLKNDPWAKKAGLKEGTIRAFKTGKTRSMKMETLQKLANAAGSTIQEMLGELPSSAQKNDKRLSEIHSDLDTAIELWINEKSKSTIIKLATGAYNALYRLAINGEQEPVNKAERSFNFPPLEQIIIGSISALILMGEGLTLLERGFYCWNRLQNPKSVSENDRTLIMKFFPGSQYANIKKLTKRNFFHAFIANSCDIGGVINGNL